MKSERPRCDTEPSTRTDDFKATASSSGFVADRPLTGAQCECTACGARFRGSFSFERHRVGQFAVREGASRRRCMTAAEMAAIGLHPGPRGWARTFRYASVTLQIHTVEAPKVAR
jgi:hypothetical protein